jgi:hypothetical protein
MNVKWLRNLRVNRRVLVATAFTVAAFTLACRGSRGSSDQDLYPRSGEVPGWKRAAEMRTFPAEKLWEYIDGGAERYVRAGVVRTLAMDYRFKGNTDAVVDIYVMKSADGPKTLMESEPAESGRPVNLGEAGTLYKASLVFRRGRHFVRVVAYQQPPEADALPSLGSAIDAKLKQHKE